MQTVLVTGVGGPAGQNVANLLLERGFAVVGTDIRELEPPGMRFCRVPAARDPAFLPELRRLAREMRPVLLIPTVTEELPIIAGGWACFEAIPAVVSSQMAVETA